MVVRNFIYDENTLPHKVDSSKPKQFYGVRIRVIPYRRSIDISVGQLDKTLLIVFEEREGFNPDQPNYIAGLGPIATGGLLDVCSSLI